MNDFKEEHDDHDLELAGVIFNATTEYSPEENRAKADVRAIAKSNGWYVFKADVPYSRSYPKGAREGQPIFRTSYARTTSASRFRKFAEEFAERVNL